MTGCWGIEYIQSLKVAPQVITRQTVPLHWEDLCHHLIQMTKPSVTNTVERQNQQCGFLAKNVCSDSYHEGIIRKIHTVA